VRSNAEGTGAVSISVATVKGKNMGRDVDGKYRVTHVWSKTPTGWRLASGQTTAVTASAASTEKPAANANAASNASAPAANANK
jgi:ketosteroid isomerase-like protein